MVTRGPAWTPCGVLGSAPAAHGTPRLPPYPADLAAAPGRELEPERFFLAWEVARLAWERNPERFRPSLLLALAALAAEEEGSTRLPLAPELLDPILAAHGAEKEDLKRVASLLRELQTPGALQEDELFGAPGSYRPLVLDGAWLYSQRLLLLEERLAAALAGRLMPQSSDRHELAPLPGSADPETIVSALADVVSRPAAGPSGSPLRLSREQEQAVVAALGGRLAVVTGGPGTGKTSIVVTMLRVVARLRSPSLERIALAAPTGRAADRLRRSVREALERISDPAPADRELLARLPSASTLHRLLAFSPSGERFRRHPGNPLEEDLVVVDESSMLDLALADRLVRALPAKARLVLLGDARQLPSVEAGAVFRDLVAATSNAAPDRVARLTHSYRMDPDDPAGRAILALASAVLVGEREPLPFRRHASEVAFAGPELLLAEGPGAREAFLERWLAERISALPGWDQRVGRTLTPSNGRVSDEAGAEIEALLAHYDSLRILCATRGYGGGAGAAAVNGWFRSRLLQRRAGPRLTEGIGDGAASARASEDGGLLPGEPVLVTTNDYHRGLFNGDQGVVLIVAGDQGEPPRPCAIFRRDGELVVIPLAALQGRIAPAWATTVHKAQGIEVDYGALVLPSRSVRGLTRELVYTALTRARRSVVVVGDPDRLEEAMGRQSQRHSGLADRIAGS